MYKFIFNGGVSKPSQHVTEKFLLWSVIDGADITHRDMLENGLTSPDITAKTHRMSEYGKARVRSGDASIQEKSMMAGHNFTCLHPRLKLMILRYGFERPKQTLLFFLQLQKTGGDNINIVTLSAKELPAYFFRANSAILVSPKEAVDWYQKGTLGHTLTKRAVNQTSPRTLLDSVLTIKHKESGGRPRRVLKL